MSVDVYVFLRKEALPETAAWQAELDRLAISVQLDGDVDPRAHTGYWPATIDGADSGFEFYTDPVDETFDEPLPGLEDRDLVARFVTHSDLTELRCSMYAAAALASVTSGVYFDEETGEVAPAQRLLDEARSIED